uniref:Leucine carboxyl methyltransferase 1-like n=1 Tax=Rhizophora mucronata TaxID=61149 RepID=A0A2P2LLK9_RHIMU
MSSQARSVVWTKFSPRRIDDICGCLCVSESFVLTLQYGFFPSYASCLAKEFVVGPTMSDCVAPSARGVHVMWKYICTVGCL